MGRRAESCQQWRWPDFFLLSRGVNKRPKPRQLKASGSSHSTAGPKDQGTKARQVRSTPRQDRRFGLPVTVRLCASPQNHGGLNRAKEKQCARSGRETGIGKRKCRGITEERQSRRPVAGLKR